MARPNNTDAINGRVQGLREAKAAFQALPEIVRDRMNEAIEFTAREVVRRAQASILASPSVQTRALYNSITYTTNKQNGRAKAGVSNGTSFVNPRPGILKNVRVKGIVIPGKNGSALTSQGAKLIRPSRYAHLVEFGTRHSKQEPFMVPAVDAEQKNHIDRCARAGKAVERDMAAVGARTL